MRELKKQDIEDLIRACQNEMDDLQIGKHYKMTLIIIIILL